MQRCPKFHQQTFFRGLNRLDWTESLIFGHFCSQRKNGRNVSIAWPRGKHRHPGVGREVDRRATSLVICPGGANVLLLAVARCLRPPVLRGSDSSSQALFLGVWISLSHTGPAAIILTLFLFHLPEDLAHGDFYLGPV